MRNRITSATIWDLQEDSEGLISCYGEAMDKNYHNRLLELGFSLHEKIRCLKKTPFGGPRVFQVGDSVFSVAREIADQVFIENPVEA